MNTIRELIIQELANQLELATIGDYGQVYRGRTYFTPDELPVMAVLPAAETAERSYGEQNCTMPVALHVVQVLGNNDPSTLGETILGDMIQATVGNRDKISYISDLRYTGGGVEDYPDREDQALVVVLNLEVDYNTNIGDPYTQTSI